MTADKRLEALYDVVAVNLTTNSIRLMASGKTLPNAEAIVEMAVMRRGVDTEFFAVCEQNQYLEGQQWKFEREVQP